MLAIQALSEDIPIVKRLNNINDMLLLRGDTRDTVFKIHGESSHPEDIVLTHQQYLDFQESPEREYWREKLKSILHMSGLVIVGYSLSDPDFIYLLEQARGLASPDHPIYMFASGFDEEEVKRHYLEYNIRIIHYENPDGTHRDLIRTLNRYNPFIAKRGSPEVGEEEVDVGEAEIASSIYLFTHLRLFGEDHSALENAYAVIILSILNDEENNTLNIVDLQENIATKALSLSNIDPSALKAALDQLAQRGFISVSAEISDVSLEGLGEDAIKLAKLERESQLSNVLRSHVPSFLKKRT